MKLECVKDKLKEAINLAEKISGHNLTLPILSTILLETKNKNLIIRSTNLEVGLELEIPAKIEKSGLVAVNANILLNYLNNLKKEEKITLELDNGNLKLGTESSQTIIKSLTAEDFPIIPKINQEGGFEIKANDFMVGLQSVVFASAVSDIKPEISSVYLYNNQQELVFVATDSFRLAEKKIIIPNLNNNINIIIPFKNINELIRVLSSLDSSQIIVSYNNNQLAIQTDNLYFTLRVIDGNYPDYKQIIPTKFNTEINIKKEDFVGLLKLATVFSDRFNQIDLIIKPDSNTLELSSYNQEIGENKSSLVIKIKGEPLIISFNAKYLIDCLGSFSEQTINLRFTEANRPLMIEGINDNSFSYLVMPINK
ncbi:MAG TPA: DNA polymerase III subunit beta [Candidatus Paceibacterota bacterium]|nr:DNA polymerase III subunit beta [Candidatus Paceibacterota bacterium]